MLVGNATHDDAGVFLLNETTALVQTVDFFTPVVDDPRLFGRIAAINSLSDIYAMGARPVTALNLLATPAGGIDPTIVAAMLDGGQEAMAEAHTSIIGGHTIDDPEPKMGYAVTGIVNPDHIWRNNTARAGDRIYLTKAIGTGVIVKAVKDGVADAGSADAAAVMMATSNADAQNAIAAVGDPTACTDVTGFGLLGHLWELTLASKTRAIVWENEVPIICGAESLAQKHGFPAGSVRNWEFVAPHLVNRQEPSLRRRLLADAVTSGGLLFTVPAEQARIVEESFQVKGVPLWGIGEMMAGTPTIELV